MNKLIFATRPSALARWQTQWVINALHRLHPGLVCEEKIITTQGDRILDKPLPEIGGKGLFTSELERELLSGAVDCAVHSLKDLPVENTQGLAIGCIPERAEIRDAFISKSGKRLLELDPGSVIGTSSLRRSAQLLARRPDLVMRSLRGNVDTRVRKAMQGEYDGIVVAGAGLCRLGLEQHVTEWLPLEAMLPAPGQGALAVQCRSDDQKTLQLLAPLQEMPARLAVTAERAFLSGLGGGCSFPVAAYASFPEGRQDLKLTGLVASLDGKKTVKVTGHGNEPEELGRRLALDAIAQGAWQILTPGYEP